VEDVLRVIFGTKLIGGVSFGPELGPVEGFFIPC